MTAVHEKPIEVWKATLDSLGALQPDQLVVVHDRAPQAIQDATKAIPGATVINLEGKPGWRSPCVSFNAGLEVSRGDITLVSHSDIIQFHGNLDIIRSHFSDHSRSVLFGMVVESNPELLEGNGNAGTLLMGTGNPRPLAWSMAAPTDALISIGGWDVAYMEGVCYEDDDLTARLWKSGLDFHFRDDFAAVHQTHARGYFKAVLNSINMTTFVNRYGRRSAGDFVRHSKPITEATPGRLAWKHA